MPSRSIFSLRVVRCPACGASLPVQGSMAIVVCEYCAARVQIVRGATTPPRPPSSPSQPHAAVPHYSGFAWVVFLVMALVGAGASAAYILLVAGGGSADVQATSAPVATRGRTGLVAPDPPAPPSPPPATPAAIESPTVAPEADTAGSTEPREVQTTGHSPGKPASKSSKPAPPSGPVISVAEAKKELEPKVLACMRQTKTHSILAYMGNRSIGPVSLLSDSRTRVDGLRKKIAGTALGRCIDQAGNSVRTRAFKSNYVLLNLKNDAAPDPLAGLPAKADRKAIESVLASVKDKVLACAKKHGDEGIEEVFYLAIDGPTGKVLSARASYGSKKFKSCAEPLYRGLGFEKVKEPEVKHTYRLQL